MTLDTFPRAAPHPASRMLPICGMLNTSPVGALQTPGASYCETVPDLRCTAGALYRVRDKRKFMIGRLNHVAIAVRDIAKASKIYRDTLGAEVSAKVPQPEHGVSTVFITLPNTKIELLEPLGESSPIAKFLEKNPERRHPSRLLRGARHPRCPGHTQGARCACARRRRA